MKSIIYTHISIITFSIFIVIFWTINTSLIFNKILGLNYDEIFTYYHINFKREILKDPDYPWDLPIKYFVEKSHMKENVRKAIYELQNNTCIKFEEQEKFFNDSQGLIFKEGSSCFSFYGAQFKRNSQEIQLSSKCYISPFIILHEIGHALGLMHEHARMARDKYIKIDESQLDDYGKENFRIRDNITYYKNYSTAYDYASVMHYGPFDFGSFWKWLFGYPVMESKLHWQYTYMMGQHEKATFNDYKRINLAHCNSCNFVDNNTGEIIEKDSNKCRNSGYPDFRDCNKCICPTGYTGNFCEEIIKSEDNCGNTTFFANETRIPLIIAYKMKCYIQFKTTKNNTRVQLSISYINAPPYKKGICVESSAFQIKYRRDRGATGLLLCGHQSKALTITSESKTILLLYEGIDNHSSIIFNYHEVPKNEN